jgi:hypothetical protein
MNSGKIFAKHSDTDKFVVAKSERNIDRREWSQASKRTSVKGIGKARTQIHGSSLPKIQATASRTCVRRQVDNILNGELSLATP